MTRCWFCGLSVLLVQFWVKGTGLNCVARDTKATGRPSVCGTLISRLLDCPCVAELVWRTSIKIFNFPIDRFGKNYVLFGWDSVVLWPTKASCVVCGVFEQCRSWIGWRKNYCLEWDDVGFVGFLCDLCSLSVGHWSATCGKRCWSYTGRRNLFICDALNFALAGMSMRGRFGVNYINQKFQFCKGHIWKVARCFLDRKMWCCGPPRPFLQFEVVMSDGDPESAVKINIVLNETMLVLWVFCVTCAV